MGIFCRLFQAIERDVRRTSADPDENDLLHEALNRLTTLLTSLLTRTLGKINPPPIRKKKKQSYSR
jgi:hypothetical protein